MTDRIYLYDEITASGMTEFISLKEVAAILKKKDDRTAERFCKSNGVEIFLDTQGTKKKVKRVLQMQFEYIRMKATIQYFKRIYKETWIEAFKAYTSADIINVIEFEERKGQKNHAADKTLDYLSENDKKVLSRLTRKGQSS